jgi:hypothetical protein
MLSLFIHVKFRVNEFDLLQAEVGPEYDPICNPSIFSHLRTFMRSPQQAFLLCSQIWGELFNLILELLSSPTDLAIKKGLAQLNINSISMLKRGWLWA